MRYYALNDPAAGLLVANSLGDRDAFDLRVRDHRRELRTASLGVRQKFRAANVGDVRDGAMSFQFQFALASASLWGVVRDAAYVVKHLDRHRRTQAAYQPTVAATAA